ncbi:MAG: cytochrome c3 family protein [Ignavibacteria bacterium]|nr:cytochrome c3 family protein [Ignavibacteria bacterium]
MFSRQFDKAVKVGGAVAGATGAAIFLIVYFSMWNDNADVGYRPQQPVPFSHKMHVGTLQISCQYCHAGVESSAHSPIPSTQTCMNCHTLVKAESPKLKVVRESFESGQPIEWVRIHKLPDYAHFNHSRHIRAQIDCKSCHGPIEEMGVVSQFKPLSMGWCIDCHRKPESGIIGARPISGVFTGRMHNVKNLKDSAYIFTSIEAQIGKSTPMISPSYGQMISPLPAHVVAGIPHPKSAGIGPETCSTCHY